MFERLQLERIRKARRDESGFTLIELLIVIVILGILAAIVVFAVNGIQDRGTASACKADVETVTVAAEAYDAQHGQYAESMDDLVKAGLLHSVPSSSSYTVDYKVSGDPGSSQRVSVSSDYCASAASDPSSDVPSSSDQTSASFDRSAYCDLLQSTMRNLSGVDINSVEDDAFNVLIQAFDSLAGAAPDGIAQDWQQFATALASVETILNNAGLHWRDLNDAENGDLPDMSQADSDALKQQIQDAFDNSALGAAMNEIGQDANDNCSLDVGKG
jgi:prepilin-type N-terminal cleavage/methylation domain-containing protein